ncbi:hypothetical protein K438DRAFT_1757924 [Mycena galopus ATCC 62051]|nr:hypothetical protein K438DRAFT_1757924 [Mycena galopus ATCC 62051]
MPPKRLRFNGAVEQYEYHRSENNDIENHPEDAPNAPGPTKLKLNSWLLHHRLPLDFSLPSTVFNSLPGLGKWFYEPACDPPCPRLVINVPSVVGTDDGWDIEVRADGTDCVTVGVVVRTIRNVLRQPLGSNDADVGWYRVKRIDTLSDARCSALDARTIWGTQAKESKSTVLRVDHLRGNVQFAGIIVSNPARPHEWTLVLERSERYGA